MGLTRRSRGVNESMCQLADESMSQYANKPMSQCVNLDIQYSKFVFQHSKQ